MKRLRFIIIILAILITVTIILIYREQPNGENEMINGSNISQALAKQIMDENPDILIIDVRTTEEFNQGHIENALSLSDEKVATQIQNIAPDKNQLILIYCRSGRRSQAAVRTMVNLGYTNVYNFGGIIDWQYGIVR